MASNAANSASGNDIFGRNSLLHWDAYDGALTSTIEQMDVLHTTINTMRQTNHTISWYADDLQESINRLNVRADEFAGRIEAAKEALHAHATLSQSLGRELLEKRRDLSGRLPDPLQSESKAPWSVLRGPLPSTACTNGRIRQRVWPSAADASDGLKPSPVVLVSVLAPPSV